MEKSIVLYLVIMLVGYVKHSDGADGFMESSWNSDILSPGTGKYLFN